MISLVPFVHSVTVVFPQPFVLGQYGGVVLVSFQPAPDEFSMLVEFFLDDAQIVHEIFAIEIPAQQATSAASIRPCFLVAFKS